ncbi:MYND finger family protein [Ophiocordyceps sinensis CO18]|uniref:MYND finger family protein n=1 Tax=Ophiocordyceps sinensis (strain Co18 / CGMCC 3.14243) TaxID=911162 RepID=T5AJ89_OPHSC|nr:MYND finger family protein [Ophiocordyceps sinensis CO18]
MAASELVCASWEPGHDNCLKNGRYSCKGCLLVTPDCKSPLGRKNWLPAWFLENRKPSFIGPEIGKPFGARKHLWGNVPAIDVLGLGANEGDEYGRDLRLLFAASGDLRNLVKTIAQLPSSYSHSIEATINDRDLDVMARNVILLLIALVVQDVEEKIDCMIHVWYSVLIRKTDNDLVQHHIRPLIEAVCAKIKDKDPGSLLGKTWEFGRRSLRVVLEKRSWDCLLSFLDVPSGLTAERALEIRAAVTNAGTRRDHRHRRLYCLSPSHRIATNQFWEEGLLLPFGSRRADFCQPNPTFFQSPDTWPMTDSADPLDGWYSKDVAETSHGPATADLYGKLFFHIRSTLRSFLARLSDSPVTFQIFQVDVAELPRHLEPGSFGRIEASNLADNCWLGIVRTLALMVPLLQVPLDNPHATLITLFMNAVMEATTMQDNFDRIGPTTKPLVKYLPKLGPHEVSTVSTYHPEIIKFALGRDVVSTYDHIFDRYSQGFSEVANMLWDNNTNAILEDDSRRCIAPPSRLSWRDLAGGNV